MLSFLKSVFSEEGQGSYSRFMGGLIVVATLGWVTYIVVRTHGMPDLGGPTMFITASSGTHYLTNKASDILASLKGKSTETGQ